MPAIVRAGSQTAVDETSLDQRDRDSVREPLGLEFRKGALVTQGINGRGDSCGQLRALRQNNAKVVAIGGGLELADNDAIIDLSAGHVERGRKVDDDRVNLAILQGSKSVVGVVVDRSLLGQLITKRVRDELLRGGAGLNAELNILQFCDALSGGSSGTFNSNNSLRGRVVRAGEINGRLALVRDGELLKVDVPVLCARSDRRIEGCAGPLDVFLAVAEFFGDSVCDGCFEAFTGFGSVIDNPRGVGRFAGGDGQFAGGDGFKRTRLSGNRCGRFRRGVSRTRACA